MKHLTNEEIYERVQAVIRNEAAALEFLADYVKQDHISEIVNLLAKHQGHIYTCACGTSGVTARKIAHSMSCIEKSTTYIAPSDAVHGGLGRLREGDIMIFISKGAQSAELEPVLAACKTKKVICITTTENPDGALAKGSDYIVPMNVHMEADPFKLLATSSTLAAMSIWDAIVITLLEMTEYTRERFGVIHPGGAVGVKLLSSK